MDIGSIEVVQFKCIWFADFHSTVGLRLLHFIIKKSTTPQLS